MAGSNGLIIVGASARAAATSAIAAGFEPWCADLFADRDLQQISHVEKCPADQYPHGLLPIIEQAPLPRNTPVMYTGGLENAPQVIDGIALRRPVFGCSGPSVRAVRQPKALASIRRFADLRLCTAYRGGWPMMLRPWLFVDPRRAGRYLSKPVAGCGGSGIEPWHGRRIGRDRYIQRYVKGTSVAAVYIADGWSARLIGVTEQIIGDEAFGVGGFRYCGSIGPYVLTDGQRDGLAHLGVAVAQRYDLRGPFGVDAIIDRRGRVRPVEVNPRYCASMEVVEKVTGQSCIGGPVPPPNLPPNGGGIGGAPLTRKGTAGRTLNQPVSSMFAKAVVFAQADCVAPDLYEWFSPHEVADVPHIGDRVRRGRPICTLFAAAADRDTTLVTLRDMAARLYDGLHA